ncbi:MarR family winged helix-turn-helix transcriptional regulator [Acetobacterium woodii]|uniref:Transcriptional regulator MerR family n=1 Tax=Acetobacterium woodii (strain ATCC 29683 / DSM 1030 / JCM 2381 / KCTC 1655 / WB1) TaxID=931626 RepID=H6LK54_ACEWD|nr:MarR family winged helix-turn-helix transcriptional regulator [Acetobacterium woodii]AFA49974.1 transcriptional regulator MerR family [Acetobacterium woodii DSM 1030]
MKTENQNKKSSVCNCLNLRRASLAITEIYDQYLAPCQLSVSQFSILKHIHAMAPVSVSELAAEIRLDRTTLVRNLKPLEQQGLIHDIAKAGTRNRQLCLTVAGKEKLEQAHVYWQEAQKRIEAQLGSEDTKILQALLLKIEVLEP